MADIAASVPARLKNKATESGRNYQLCLQLFCQEEFLRRLGKSKYSENLVLKGGLFIYSLTDFDSRVTVDLDFLLREMPNTPEQLKTMLEEIFATSTGNDFITFEIKDVVPIAVAKKYAGIDASVNARMKNTKTQFSIDFAVGDVIVPKHEKRKIPTQLSDFDAPTVNTYSLETTIAEKLDAILSLMEFSSRMKDYYDIYYLANKFDFDGKVLAEALKKTFENRGHRFTVEQFEQVMGFDDDAAMQMDAKLIKALYANEETRKRFFTDVDGIAVFDKVRFGWVINNRQFLPDSYTRYKNKIGLADSKGNYIATSNDMGLVFLYKDCILEGGQTEEDQKRSEIFYNETPARDEADRLLYPKVFTNAKRYTVDGVENVTDFSSDDNLIIKGNNLLSISSLLKRYDGKIKCIFVDPPYYFNKKKDIDSFNYNSSFKLSSWLTFCKTRFEIAKKLLSENGVLIVTMGVDGYSHLM